MSAVDRLTELRMLKRNVAFAMIPYFVIDLPLSVYAKSLYMLIVRRCGAAKDGVCFESVEHMAKHLAISPSTVVKAKSELANVGLVTITKRSGPQGHGGYASDIITLIDIELENAFFYSPEYLTSERRRKNIDLFGKLTLLRLRYELNNMIAELRSQAECDGSIKGTMFAEGHEAASFGNVQPSPREGWPSPREG